MFSESVKKLWFSMEFDRDNLYCVSAAESAFHRSQGKTVIRDQFRKCYIFQTCTLSTKKTKKELLVLPSHQMCCHYSLSLSSIRSSSSS